MDDERMNMAHIHASGRCAAHRCLRFFSILALAVMYTSLCALAGEPAKNDAPEMKKIAVLGFSNNNTPEYVSRAVRNIIEVAIFASGDFQLIEYEHIRKVIQGSGFGKEGMGDADAIELGGRLKADYLIAGSIDKIEKYRITARAISIAEKKILVAYSHDIDGMGELDRITEKIAKDIAADIEDFERTGTLRRHFYDVYRIKTRLSGELITPLGRFHDLVNNGYGISITTEIGNVFIDNVFVCLGVGYQRFTGKISSSDSCALVPLWLSLGFDLELSRMMSLKPSVSSGMAFITMKHGITPGFNMAPGSERTCAEPMFAAGVSYNVRPMRHLDIDFSVRYGFIYEPEGPLHFMVFGFGFGYSF